MAETKNPFDLSDLLKKYDPQVIIKQFQDAISGLNVPNVDTKALLESQQKNMETLINANQAALSGTQELFKRQAEMMQQALSDATEAAKELAGVGVDPKALVAKQTELIQTAFEKTLANSHEISDLVRKKQEEVAQVVTKRVTESLGEVKEAISKLS